MKITAAVARAPHDPFSIEEVELGELRDDEVLVRVAAVGVCHTDLIMKAVGMVPLPAVLGHEGAGVVERVGSAVSKVAPGDRVTLTFMSCGDCPRCNAGDPAYCHRMFPLNFGGKRMDGRSTITASNGSEVSSNFFGQSSFATHCIAYQQNVVKLDADMPFELAAPLGCGVQTGAGAILRSLDCAPGSSLLVVGGGAVGLSSVMAAKLRGCGRIIVMEPHASRRTLALELGATDVLDPADAPELAPAVRGIEAQGVDYIFDTTGNPDLLNGLLDCLASKGTLGTVGGSPPGSTMPNLLARLVPLGLTIRGILEGDSDPDTFIPELIGHYRAGKFPVDRLVATFPFPEINQAIADQHHGKCVKVVLLMNGAA